jgi:hypothetical protein
VGRDRPEEFDDRTGRRFQGRAASKRCIRVQSKAIVDEIRMPELGQSQSRGHPNSPKAAAVSEVRRGSCVCMEHGAWSKEKEGAWGRREHGAWN